MWGNAYIILFNQYPRSQQVLLKRMLATLD